MSNFKPPNVEIKISGDGSHTLYNPELDETYHSHHGAITESKHVFIDAGLRSLIGEKKEIRILEVGFGTGLNALLSLAFAEAHPDIDFHYHTLEPYPLSWDVAKNLNYVDQVVLENGSMLFEQMHKVESGKSHTLLPNFTFSKHLMPLNTFSAEIKFNVVFYDAFAPSKQSEMWEYSQLEHLSEMVANEGVLVTYCSKGQFKRDLKALNFLVQELPGPPGKREMTRGIFNRST